MGDLSDPCCGRSSAHGTQRGVKDYVGCLRGFCEEILQCASVRSLEQSPSDAVT